MARSSMLALALSFALWRDRVPPEAICISAPSGPRFAALPAGLQRWLRRTGRGDNRVAFARGAEWWAYDFVNVTAGAGASGNGIHGRFFVIASSDRYDPEWGADHDYLAETQAWVLSPHTSDITRRRLTSGQVKA